jgi:hypothetical protein
VCARFAIMHGSGERLRAALIGGTRQNLSGLDSAGSRMFARTSHSPIEPKLLAAREAISREIRLPSGRNLTGIFCKLGDFP